MRHKLSTVLREGMTFRYEYDFGSTTELMITVVNYSKKALKKEKLTLLSRNNPHEYLCSECGKKPAAVICMECLYEFLNEVFLCEDCAKTHACDEEMRLNVCNSPRMGVCGYGGVSSIQTSLCPMRRQHREAVCTRRNIRLRNIAMKSHYLPPHSNACQIASCLASDRNCDRKDKTLCASHS